MVITTRHIAEQLQLSVSTVGRALADDDRISEQTKLRVRRAAEEMGYVGNLAARMMRGVSSKVVGLVVPDIRNSFYVTIAHELSAMLGAAGVQLTLAETNDDPATELRQLRELAARRVAGVAIVPTAHPLPDAASLLHDVAHVQLLRRHPSLGPVWFGLDDRGAVREAVGHLVDLGHTRIGYIGGPVERSTGQHRLAGYRQALREAGVPRRNHLVKLGPPRSLDHSRVAIRNLLEHPSPPTAVALGSVQHTAGALDELFRTGVRVPEEFSVVGFGDEIGFSWWGPGLTTLGLPILEIATACGSWFMRRLDPRTTDDGASTSISPASIVVRGSTGAPAPARNRPV